VRKNPYFLADWLEKATEKVASAGRVRVWCFVLGVWFGELGILGS
jgi:hypothetical protein